MEVKAIVAKIDKEKGILVVLTKDRQFKKLPLTNNPPMVGSTINISLPPGKTVLGRFFKPRWLAVAAVMLISFIGISVYLGISPASAYVALDMKPSLQLAVNNHGQVLGVTGLNKEGKEMVKQLDLTHKDVYLAVQEVVRQASQNGFFDSNSENLVMAVYTTRKTGYQIDKNKLREAINGKLSINRYPGYVVVNQLEWSRWQSASDTGYSANKLIMVESAKKKGIPLDPDTLNHGDMMQTIKRSHASVPRLFPESSYKITWEEHHEKMGTQDNSAVTPDSGNMHNSQKRQTPDQSDANSDGNGMMHGQVPDFNSQNKSRDAMPHQNLERTNDNTNEKATGKEGMMGYFHSPSSLTKPVTGNPLSATGNRFMPHM